MKQNLFQIVQGGLHRDLRQISLWDMVGEQERSKRIPGYQIGGLSGGEAKNDFWRVVEQCTDPTC